MELCLGTVQFGMRYGIANTIGQPTTEQSLEMLKNAVENGIITIDTASAYGTAEDIVGQFLKSCQKSIRVVTKLKPNLFEESNQDVDRIVRCELETSLSRLGLDAVDGYLLHTPSYVYRKDILHALSSVKNAGLTKNIGVSIYEMEDGFAAIESEVIDYIQLPFSIFDQRAYHSGLLQKAKENGIKIFARSIFVQGLALMEEEKVIDKVKMFVPHLKAFKKLMYKYNLEDVGVMIAFVREISNIDYLVFGIDTITQLNENITGFQNYCISPEVVEEALYLFKRVDKSIIIPSLWALHRN